MADDLDFAYIQTRQNMREYQSRMLMEPVQQGSDVYMGAKEGGKPQDGNGVAPKPPTPEEEALSPTAGPVEGAVTLGMMGRTQIVKEAVHNLTNAVKTGAIRHGMEQIRDRAGASPDATLPPEQPAAPQEPNTITVDRPEVAAVKQQFAVDMQKMATGEGGVEALGRGGKALAEATRPGFVTAARALGMDEQAAETVGDAFVEFMGGLPGGEQSDFTAGIETALAALPVIHVALKAGGKATEFLAANKDAIIQEFQKAAKLLKNERGSVPLGPVGAGPEDVDWRKGDRLVSVQWLEEFNALKEDGAGNVSHPRHEEYKEMLAEINSRHIQKGKNTWQQGRYLLRDPATGDIVEGADDVQTAMMLKRLTKWKDYEIVDTHSATVIGSGSGGGKPPKIIGPGASSEDPLSPKQLATIAKREESKQAFGFAVEGFSTELTKQRRGPVLSDEAVRKLAGQSGFTLQDLLDLKPGSILAPEIQVAAREVYDKAADRLRASAKTYLEVADQEALADFADAFATAGVATTRIIGTFAEGGRTFRTLNQKYPTMKTGVTPKPTDPEFNIQDAYIQQMYKFFQGMEDKSKMGGFARPRGSGVEQDMITPGHLAEMVSKLKSREELMTFAKAAAKPTWGDMMYEVWVNGLLSGPITHSTNIISNAATLLWNIPERQVASLIKPGSVRPGEAAAMVGGVLESVGDAWRLAWKAFKQDAPQFGASKLENMPRQAITADALEVTGIPGRAIDFLASAVGLGQGKWLDKMGTGIRLPGRFLMAGDDFFKSIAFRAELRSLAKRQAFREVNELGLTGKEAARKAKEIEQKILTDPPETIKQDAQEFAAYTTFTRELGTAGSAVQNAVQNVPFGRVVLPFIRTPANIFKFAGERTPLALASKAVRDEMAAGGERQALALAKIGLGSMTMAYMATLAANGHITGGGPKDKVLRKQLELEGWQPYSFKIGNEYVSYARIEPLGSLIGMAADAADLMGQLGTKDSAELASALTVALSRNVANKTFVKGLAGTLNAVTSQDVHVVKSFLEKELPTLMPYSSAMGQTAKVVDPVMRDVKSLLDAFQAKVPGYSADLPPQRNLYGDKVLLQGGMGPDLFSPLYVREIKNDPVAHELSRLAYPFAMPARNIDGIDLPPKLYDRYAELAGKGSDKTGNQTLQAALNETMQTGIYKQAADGPDGGKVTLIKATLNRFREMAALQLEQENKDFAQARQTQRMRAATKFDQNARQKAGPAPTLQ